MVESKYILYSIVAGVLAGAFASVIMAIWVNGLYEQLIYDIIHQQLLSQGIPPKEALRITNQTMSAISHLSWLFYISPLINMFFMSVILGIVLDLLVNKVKLNPSIASVTTGLIFIFLLQLLPIYALNLLYGGEFIEIINKYIGLWLIITPSVLYTLLLTIFNTLKGPWIKWGEAKPETY